MTPQLLLHTPFWFLTLPPSSFREIHWIYHSKIASDDYPILKTVHSIPSHLPLDRLSFTVQAISLRYLFYQGLPVWQQTYSGHENHFTCLECALIILITLVYPVNLINLTTVARTWAKWHIR